MNTSKMNETRRQRLIRCGYTQDCEAEIIHAKSAVTAKFSLWTGPLNGDDEGEDFVLVEWFNQDGKMLQHGTYVHGFPHDEKRPDLSCISDSDNLADFDRLVKQQCEADSGTKAS